MQRIALVSPRHQQRLLSSRSGSGFGWNEGRSLIGPLALTSSSSIPLRYFNSLSNSTSSLSSSKQKSTKTTTEESGDEVSKKNLYSETLNLPKTTFPMRSQAKLKEPLKVEKITKQLYLWQQQQQQQQQEEEGQEKKEFILHDGPPYANGLPHIGHVLNKVLKDIVNRYKLLQGHTIWYIPGWDCHGLPIETKALGGKPAALFDPIEIRKKAKLCAEEAMEIQRKAMERWGVLSDPSQVYTTMSPDYEVSQLGVFFRMFEKGLIYRGLKPVYWSPSSRTALAEAELEYPESHTSRSVYFSFKFRNLTKFVSSAINSGREVVGGEGREKDQEVWALAWTTTPWSIPGNLALCVNPEMWYIAVKATSEEKERIFIIAEDRLSQLQQTFSSFSLTGNHNTPVTLEVVGERFQGSKLVGSEAVHPFFEPQRSSVVLSGLHVTNQSGTGIVHTAPGHGFEDFGACQEAGILSQLSGNGSGSVICPVDAVGRFTEDVGVKSLIGKEVLGEGNEAVIEILKEKGALVWEEKYNHKYPYDWRTKKPVIIRATTQWFASIEEIKRQAMNSIEKEVQMIPHSGKNRLLGMLSERRGEWCISRQRVWGVPIPVFYNKETDAPLINKETIEHLLSLVAKQGTDCWWTMSEEQLLPPSYREQAPSFRKGTDTMDVWFDSGTSWSGVVEREGKKLPVDLYLEGSDQHRGWFQSSLLTSVAIRGIAPYRQVLTHGFVLDEKGQKMSKSLGNVVDPDAVINGNKFYPPYGADVLRLWVSSVDYTKDMSIGPNVLARISDSLRKIRNTLRFLLANLSDFNVNISSNHVPYSQMPEVDKYLLHLLFQLGKEITEGYETYSFSKVYQTTMLFVNTDLSAFYLDTCKDRLYADAPDSISRRSCQTVLHAVLEVLTKGLAPIIPFTMEDVSDHNPFKVQDSVFKSRWFELPSVWCSPELHLLWEKTILKLRGAVNVSIETARNAKVFTTAQEAHVILFVSERCYQMLSPLLPTLPEVFHVAEVKLLQTRPGSLVDSTSVFTSEVKLLEGEVEEVIQIHVSKTNNRKCLRCWAFNLPLEGTFVEVCPRCSSLLQQKP